MSQINKEDIISQEALDALHEMVQLLERIIELKSIAFDGGCDKK